MKRADIDLLESALGHLIAGLEDLKTVVASLGADDEREDAAMPPPPEPTRTKPDGLLTVTEVAHILRCHRDTVYAMVDRGELAETRVGRRRLIDPSSLPKPTRAEPLEIPSAKPRQMNGRYLESYAKRVVADRTKGQR